MQVQHVGTWWKHHRSTTYWNVPRRKVWITCN